MLESSKKEYVTVVFKKEKQTEVQQAILNKNVKIGKPKQYSGNNLYYFETDIEYSRKKPSDIQNDLIRIQDFYLGFIDDLHKKRP